MEKATKRLQLVCEECGITFERYPSQLTRSTKYYCSLACAGRATRRGSVLHCAYCDSEFYRHFAEQDVGKKINQFCSRDCYMEWRAVNRKSSTYPKIGAAHQHRLVAEAVLGRKLTPQEVVHHIDLDKHNTNPRNLAVFPDQATHMRCHAGAMSDEELRGFSLIKAE